MRLFGPLGVLFNATRFLIGSWAGRFKFGQSLSCHFILPTVLSFFFVPLKDAVYEKFKSTHLPLWPNLARRCVMSVREFATQKNKRSFHYEMDFDRVADFLLFF